MNHKSLLSGHEAAPHPCPPIGCLPFWSGCQTACSGFRDRSPVPRGPGLPSETKLQPLLPFGSELPGPGVRAGGKPEEQNASRSELPDWGAALPRAPDQHSPCRAAAGPGDRATVRPQSSMLWDVGWPCELGLWGPVSREEAAILGLLQEVASAQHLPWDAGELGRVAPGSGREGRSFWPELWTCPGGTCKALRVAGRRMSSTRGGRQG